jgi:hypothetical protein
MAYASVVLTALATALGVAGGPLPDLSKIDRTIAREPAFKNAPLFCLLVFGPVAETRVWLVKDGETLYVDRNANGDLTEPGESLEPTERRSFMTFNQGKQVPYRELTYMVGDLSPVGANTTHTKVKLVQYQTGDDRAEDVLSVDVGGTLPQFAGWTPLFCSRQQEAMIVHFGGAMIPQRLRFKTLSLSQPNQSLHLRFATPGLGKNAFASLGYEAVPKDVHPLAVIEWPAAASNAPPIKTEVSLASRC